MKESGPVSIKYAVDQEMGRVVTKEELGIGQKGTNYEAGIGDLKSI